MLQILLPAWTVCLDLFFYGNRLWHQRHSDSCSSRLYPQRNGCWLFLGSDGAGKVVGVVSARIVLQTGWCGVTGSYGGSNAIKKLC